MNTNQPTHFQTFKIPLFIFILAVVLRLCNLTTTSLWIDEIYSFQVANGHLPPAHLDGQIHTAAAYAQQYLAWQPFNWHTLIELLKINVHMPLFYVLLNPWLGLLGNTEFGLRSFAALFSVLMLLPIYQLGKSLGGGSKSGYFSMLIAAVVPFQLYFAQEGRMYTLSLLWAALSTFAFWKILYANRPFGWSVLYAFSLLGGFFSHYMFVFYLAFHAIYALLWLLKTKDWKRFSYFSLAAGLLVIAAWAWAPIYQIQQQGVNDDYHFAKGLKNPMRYLTALVWQPLVMIAGDNKLERLFYMPLTAILFLFYLFKPKSPQAEGKRFRFEVEGFLLAWIFVPLLVQIAYDLLKHTHTVVIDRYVLLISPAICLWLGLSLNQLWALGKQKWVAGLVSLMILLGVAAVWSPSPFRDEHNKKDIRGKIAWMTQQAKVDDLVVVNGPFGAVNLAAWYLSKSRPQQPILYWISEVRQQAVPLPDANQFKPYRRIWLFRDRANNERGLQRIKDYLQSMYPHLKREKDWFIYTQ